MNKKVVSGKAFGTFESGLWTLKSKNIKISYGFDGDLGIYIHSFINSSGSREVNYIQAKESILPYKIIDRESWTFVSGDVFKSEYGGKEVLKLNIKINSSNFAIAFHAVVFPQTSVIRQWFTIYNTDDSDAKLVIQPFKLSFYLDDKKDIYHAIYFNGGRYNYEHGLMHEIPLGTGWGPEVINLLSNATRHFVPMMIFRREAELADAFMIALEYTGAWSMQSWRNPLRNNHDKMNFSCSIDGEEPVHIKSGLSIETPVITLAVFEGELDNFMFEIYDWQYTYLWDYTNNDYFAKTRSMSRFVYCSRNLHEQFIYRTSVLGMDAQLCQKMGYDIIWDDAGWSACSEWPDDGYGSLFLNNYEGPDYRLNKRFFDKCGLKWLLWFAGKPSLGLLNSKEGAWGTFEWRTDAIENSNFIQDNDFKKSIVNFLDENPERSFHTCSGGSAYSHTFDIMRYANYNYLADLGVGPYRNYYFSYFEIPDKWGDILCFCGDRCFTNDGGTICLEANDTAKLEEIKYIPEFARATLGSVMSQSPYNRDEDIEANRIDLQIYHYLLSCGVVGRWSYMLHPDVIGDKEYYYLQRISRDMLRSCIILRHRPRKPITVYPKRLIASQIYEVSFQERADKYRATGKELAECGIKLNDVKDGELIYLNLSNRPGAGNAEPVAAPVSAYKKTEINIGHLGTAIYWSAVPGENSINRCEILRDGNVIGSVCGGQYYFDNSGSFAPDAEYSVCSINRDGIRSSSTVAKKLEDNASIEYSALGQYGENMSENGWHAEFSSDLKTFTAMTFVAPEKTPLADFGGKPNQIGGIEGWWVAGKCAKVGHGWQQASSEGYSIRTFVCPKDGKITVTGRAIKEWYHNQSGSDLKVALLKNKEIIVDWQDVKRGDIYGAAMNISLDVKQGDKLRFVLSKSNAANEELIPWEKGAELVGWIPVISYNTTEKNKKKNFIQRINCGSLTDFTDNSGNVWQADSAFCGGKCADMQAEGLFATARTGKSIKYSLNVPEGIYAVRLSFFETQCSRADERVMKIFINGYCVESEMDIMRISRGGRAAQKVYRYITASKGVINIELTGADADAFINGIELAGENNNIIHINCGSNEDFIDWAGNVWGRDKYYSGGKIITTQVKEMLQATPTQYDRDLYFSARCGNVIEYKVPVTDGIYTVHLKFAEFWTEQPDRPMDITINKNLVKKLWDPFNAVGQKNMAADIRFEHISSVNGLIEIKVTACGNNPAIIQAIEVE